MSKLQFRLMRTPYNMSTAIFLSEEMKDGRRAFAEPVAMRVYSEEEMMTSGTPAPMLEIRAGDEREAFQSLMDELWKIGVRPSDIGTPGHLAATQAHLADFRALVAKTLEVKLP